MALPTCGAGAFGARLHLRLRLRLTERGRIWIVHYCQLAQVAIGIYSFIIDMDIAFWQVLVGHGLLFSSSGKFFRNCW